MRASEDKLWAVLVHPHTSDAGPRGLQGNIPRWRMPAKARNEHSTAMVREHHGLHGGFTEFYKAPLDTAVVAPATESAGLSLAAPDGGPVARRAVLPPLAGPGGDRRHFEQRYCEERLWHPSFKRATIDVFPCDCRVSRTRAVAIDNDGAPGPKSSIYSENINPSER